MKQKEGYIKNFFKQLDFFSVTFEFRVDSKQRFTTLFGGLCFLFYLSCIISYVLKSFFDYISFTDFKILFIDRYEDKAKIDITDQRFFYFFQFSYEEVNSTLATTDLENDVLTSKYKDLFIVEHNYVVKNIETDISNKTKIPIVKCDIEHIKRFDRSVPANATFSNFYKNQICFKYQNYSIYGLYTDKIMSYIEVTLKLNSTYYTKNMEALKDVFTKVNFKFNPYYSDYIYDVSNLTNPLTNRIESFIYSYVDINYYEKTNIFFNELIYEQDHNLFFKQPRNQTYIKFSNFDRYLYPILGRFEKKMNYGDKYNLIRYYFRPNMKKSVIRITLIKIPEFLSGISAISTSLLIIFNVIVTYFNSFKAKQKIIQKIMKYNDVIRHKNKDYFEYFLTNMKEKIPGKNEATLKNNYVLNKSKNNELDKSRRINSQPFIKDVQSNPLCANHNEDDLKNEKKFRFASNTLKNYSKKVSRNNNKLKDCNENIQTNISKYENDENKNTHSPNPKTKKEEIYNAVKNNYFNTIETSNKKMSTSQYRKIEYSNNLSLMRQSGEIIDSKNKFITEFNFPVKLLNDKKTFSKDHLEKEIFQENLSSPESNNNNNETPINNYQKDLFIENNNDDKKEKELNNKNEDYNSINQKPNENKNNPKDFDYSSVSKKDNFTLPESKKKIENKSTKKKNKNPLEITCFELFFNCFICKNAIKRKKKVFDMAEEKFNYNLDILTYLRRMLEMDILKYLILDKNLINIMNFISKPSVSYKTKQREIESEFKLFFNNQSPDKEINMVAIKNSFDAIIHHPIGRDGFKKQRNKLSKNSINEKMLRLFKNQIEEIVN